MRYNQSNENELRANLSNTKYFAVRECCLKNGYRITDYDNKAMLNWYDGGGQIDILSSLEPWQFYNHFPGIWSISRKVELAKNIDKMNRFLPELYTFHPKTFVLPGQYNDLRGFMFNIPKRNHRTFIIKPDAGSQGRGIMLIQNPDMLEDYTDPAVAQQYISPFLIEGYKFDLRIYVLITSVDPLRIYIHNEGMARLCSEKYVKPGPSNLDQLYSHLTNYSLNKKNKNFQDNDDSDSGSKRSLTNVFHEIERMGYSTASLQGKIDNIIRLTIGAVQPFLASNYRSNVSSNDERSRCFEILGFDIMIDSNLNPWLIEVNCMPSLACGSQFDKDLKYSVIDGALKILNLNPNFKRLVLTKKRAETQIRISGATNIQIPTLYRPEIESKIAKTTNWRQIYPLEENSTVTSIMDLVLKQARIAPSAQADTHASIARKKAILQHIREVEEKERRKKLKEAQSKRPPFSTDTTIPLQDNKPTSQPLQRPPRRIRTNIVKEPGKRNIEKTRLNSQIQTKKPQPEISLQQSGSTNLFALESGIPISESEEHERMRYLQRQLIKAHNSSLEQAISQMTENVNPSRKKKNPEQALINRPRSEKKPRPYTRKVVKPVLVYNS